MRPAVAPVAGQHMSHPAGPTSDSLGRPRRLNVAKGWVAVVVVAPGTHTHPSHTVSSQVSAWRAGGAQRRSCCARCVEVSYMLKTDMLKKTASRAPVKTQHPASKHFGA
ncbi:uncharacterized protein LOC143028774 [Oratosquilla oratoria]|uniref:uncharacterized protein LOC143028774 n=1 Tax=Oratosquilla oratoria TaxID=337810 RepID=UPI003F7586E5